MNVFGSVPLFLSMMQGSSIEYSRKCAHKAIFIASILLFIFLFLGEQILFFFGISLDSFKIAGGLIILIIAIELVLGLAFREKRYDNYDFAVVPLATPLITGPGVITTVILLVHSSGILIALIASILNLFIAWLVLYYSDNLYRFIGKQGADVLGRVMGLILTAIAVEFIRSGITNMIS
jgi:multiple antibiotic resistance protein